jgi:hypothetical protein
MGDLQERGRDQERETEAGGKTGGAPALWLLELDDATRLKVLFDFLQRSFLVPLVIQG